MVRTTEGLVLKAKNYGEADKIYTIFTKDLGKISAIAKGVRKISSKRAGSLDLLNHIRFAFSEGKGMPLITEVSSLNSFIGAKKSFEDSKICFCVIELIDKFMQEEEVNLEVYDLALEVLEKLGKTKDAGRRLLLVYFEYKLLVLLGYDPVLNFCVSCMRDFDKSWEKIKFNFNLGGVVCDRCQTNGNLINTEILNFLVLLKTSNLKSVFGSSIKKESFTLIENLLKEYIESILETPLKSLKVFA